MTINNGGVQSLCDRIESLEAEVQQLRAVVDVFDNIPISQSSAARVLKITAHTVGNKRRHPDYARAFTTSGRVKLHAFMKIWSA
ncbi:hypothetical protein PN441_10135 [Spirulina major CS-329]|uniref:hypothetical protein n=1 Tax=Spirulina TaxID=1154 RepID=UPI00232F88B0|nr:MULTISPECIES: hypothetical protein [Spirulina]MDB9495275.1 hypothetical protein [Spirulina subsalsa CS-330]MDB9503429.1 hypothetical protein [Spirulina major CS-329]